MNIKQITGVYFSPTGNTKTAVELIAAQLSSQQSLLDLTGPGKRPDYHFLENEAVIIGVPVYGGRVPAVAAERLKKLHGRKTAAVLVVTYGNRAYEDALLELKLILVRTCGSSSRAGRAQHCPLHCPGKAGQAGSEEAEAVRKGTWKAVLGVGEQLPDRRFEDAGQQAVPQISRSAFKNQGRIFL